ncbi:MAG: hypothetical protein KKA07_03445 [Bacteroidetes bacterium]|nr:hypothetical protein [Bacteroidota bacterium]MBU1718107.1 hypothetical protein [Bacteroidota bacterium]
MKKVLASFFLGVLITLTGNTVHAQQQHYSAEFTPTGQIENQYDTVFAAVYIVETVNIQAVKKIHFALNDATTQQAYTSSVITIAGLGISGQGATVSGSSVRIPAGSIVPYRYNPVIRLEFSDGQLSEPLEWSN